MPQATHQNASGGTYVDTDTTITWNEGSNVCTVVVKCRPHLQYWSCPDAATLRKWVDALLKDSGMKRDGARYYHNDGPLDQWKYTYYLKGKK